MSQAELHLVGGFLGSGKTTAIINAAKSLMDNGLQVGVITNDQGRYLVDTAFFRLSAIPAVEVTGGCFCCNYDDLDGRLAQLVGTLHPDIIFAESVGSCADIVATVVKPLLDLGSTGAKPASYSVFADARMLRRRLMGEELPFSDDIVYIYDKQLEEAGLLVVNKVDLLSEMAVNQGRGLVEARYPGKPYLLQSSLSIAGVTPWVEHIRSAESRLPESTLEIDYQRYGEGEARLAWLDEHIEMDLPSLAARKTLIDLFSRLLALLDEREAAVGHLKFVVQNSDVGFKLSFTTIEQTGWQDDVPDLPGGPAHLLVNARAELDSDELKSLLHRVFEESEIPFVTGEVQAFHPGFPNPTHRYG